jgi:hypothetical protein
MLAREATPQRPTARSDVDDVASHVGGRAPDSVDCAPMHRLSSLWFASASLFALALFAQSAGAQQPSGQAPEASAPPSQAAPLPQSYPSQPGYPPQGYSQQPGYAPPGYPPPGYYPPPAYGAPYGYGPPPYGYGPPVGPPPPPPPKRATCCRFSIRYDPFDLLFRRLTFEGEVAIIGPLAIELVPSWIFGSIQDGLDARGFAIAGNIAFYPGGVPLRGFWVKAHVGWEGYHGTFTHSQAGSTEGATQDEHYVSSPILGAMFGSTSVFGRNGGFAISGGIGIGVATASSVTFRATAPGFADEVLTVYDKAGRIQLLGSLSLGASF